MLTEEWMLPQRQNVNNHNYLHSNYEDDEDDDDDDLRWITMINDYSDIGQSFHVHTG